MKVSQDLSKPTGLSSKYGKKFYDPKTGKMTGDSRFYYGNPKERQDVYGTGIYSGMNEELAFAGLNPSQKQNYIRQLIGADPSLGNKYGKDKYGNQLGKFFEGISPYLLPGGGFIKQLLPEQNKEEYQTYWDDNQLFYDTSVPQEDKSSYNDQFTYNTSRDQDPPPDDETPPGDENQWATASPGKIGWMDEQGNYHWGTMDEYSQRAEINPQNVKDGGIIGLNQGGYLDDMNAAQSLMFKDPQDEEEWEYNV